MKIQWKFADGATSEVDVDEELGSFITTSRREESNLERRERYHCSSLDAIGYKGLESATSTTPESELLNKEDIASINAALDKLSKKQLCRLFMRADGLSIREIARQEGVDHSVIRESIDAARKKIKNNH